MGVRGEVFSKKVILPNRTYFFNIKENRMGDIYLNIVESKNRDADKNGNAGSFERQSIVLFTEDLQEFLKGFDESLQKLEGLVRTQRRGAKSSDSAPVRDDDEGSKKPERNEYPSRSRTRSAEGGTYPSGRPRSSERAEYPPRRGKRDSERDGYPRSDRKRPAERGSYRPAERDGYAPRRGTRSADRDSYPRSDRKRPPKGSGRYENSGPGRYGNSGPGRYENSGPGRYDNGGAEHPDRPPRSSKRVVVRKK